MDLLKLIKSYLSKGFIGANDKANLVKGFEALDADTQEVLQSEYDKCVALPESNQDDETSKLVKELFSGATDNITGEVLEKVESRIEAYVKEIKEQAEKKVGVYNPEIQKDEKRKRMNAWLRKFGEASNAKDITLLKKMHSEAIDGICKNANNADYMKKELTTDSTGTPFGGYVVDSELSAEIRHLQTEYGVARREMTTLQLTKGDLQANNLATDITVNWEGEGDVIASGQVVLGQETLTLNKLAVIVTLTSELLEDQEIDLFSFIATRVAENFAKKEDEAFFKGDGTSGFGSFTGLLNNTNVNTVTMAGTTFASIDADDLIDMKDATPQGALANAKYYMHRTIMSRIRRLKDSQNQYIYQAPSQAGPATVWGDPVVMVEAMPANSDTAVNTAFVLYGDLKKACILGFKGAIRAKRFDAGVVRNVANNADINLITTDREAIRWTQRTGFIVIVASAVTRLRTAAS